MSGSNLPSFDPLHPTAEQSDAMMAGYLDGFRGDLPDRRYEDDIAYAHGRRNGVNDRAGTSDPEQAALVARARKEGALP